MALVVPGQGDSLQMLAGNRLLTVAGQMITPAQNYLSRWFDASLSPGTISNGTVSNGGNRTTDITSWASTNTSQISIAQSPDSSLRGSFNYLTSGNVASPTGDAFIETPVFTLEGSDLGKPVTVSFDVTGNTTSDDWDVVVVRYNSSGTFQERIPVAGTASTTTNTPSARIPTGTAQFRGFFVAGSVNTPNDLYALRFRRRNGVANIRLDTLYVGPQVQLAGAPVTDWQDYTPTFGAGYGSTTGVSFQWRRVGDSVEVRGRFTTGTTSAASAGISVPSGLSIATSAQGQIQGTTSTSVSSVSGTFNGALLYVPTGNTTELHPTNIGSGSSVNNLTSLNANVLHGSGQPVSVRFIVPIANWSSNVTMAERAVEEYAADDGTNDVFGPNGAPVPNTTGTGVDRIFVYQGVLQATDSFALEFKTPDSIGWFEPPVLNAAGNHFVQALDIQNTLAYGASVRTDTEANTVRVRFGEYAHASGATYGAVGQNWSVLNAAGWRWRLRKVAGGAAVGYPVGARNVVGDTTGTAVPAGYIGEQIRAAITTNTAFPATLTYGDLTSITLTPGVWDISVVLYAAIGTAAGMTTIGAAIGTVAGNNSTGFLLGDNWLFGYPPTATTDVGITIPQFRVLVASNTIYYLKYRADYTSGTPNARGRISAVRVA